MKTIGPYTILKRLGEGAFAKVYLAKTEGPGRFVTYRAVKRLHQRFLETEYSTHRFAREARIGGLVNHPNVVRILEVVDQDGEFLIGMEFVDGITVQRAFRALRKQQLTMPVPALLELIAAVLDGLAHIHGLRDPEGELHEIIHRDLKPANVMLTRDGRVKLMDFGVAKAEFGAQTNAGVLIGTPRYMSPEQARGERVDATTDVYAAGVLLFEGLMGRRIFEHLKKEALRVQVATGRLDEEFAQLRAHVAPAIAELVVKLMHPDPGHRLRSALEGGRAVREIRGTFDSSPALREFCQQRVDLFPDPFAVREEEASWSGPGPLSRQPDGGSTTWPTSTPADVSDAPEGTETIPPTRLELVAPVRRGGPSDDGPDPDHRDGVPQWLAALTRGDSATAWVAVLASLAGVLVVAILALLLAGDGPVVEALPEAPPPAEEVADLTPALDAVLPPEPSIRELRPEVTPAPTPRASTAPRRSRLTPPARKERPVQPAPAPRPEVTRPDPTPAVVVEEARPAPQPRAQALQITNVRVRARTVRAELRGEGNADYDLRIAYRLLRPGQLPSDLDTDHRRMFCKPLRDFRVCSYDFPQEVPLAWTVQWRLSAHARDGRTPTVPPPEPIAKSKVLR